MSFLCLFALSLFHVPFSKIVFFYVSTSSVSIWDGFRVSWLAFRPAKTSIGFTQNLDVCKINVFLLQLVLLASWSALGLLLGALGCLCGYL